MLSGRPLDAPGTCVTCVMEGVRPVLAEVQALVAPSSFGNPRRTSNGFDYNRAVLLLAVLEKRAGFKLGVKDVFLNMAGGLKVNDPACDLAVVSAVLSSNFDFALPSDTCFCGEVGLSGEVRPVLQTERRIIEASRLGFRHIYISSFTNLEGLETLQNPDIEIVKVSDVPSLCRTLFKGS